MSICDDMFERAVAFGVDAGAPLAVALRDFARAEVERVTTELRAELARLKQPAPVDPRRVPGAVVRSKLGIEYIVLNTGSGLNQHRLDRPDYGTFSLRESDRFVRWATREECARHGVPYVDREAKPEPVPYVPKVGDVVRHRASPDSAAWVVTSAREAMQLAGGARLKIEMDQQVYLRPATPAERIAAGIDPAPAPDLRALRDAVTDALADLRDTELLLRVHSGVKDAHKDAERVRAESERLDSASHALVARLASLDGAQ